MTPPFLRRLPAIGAFLVLVTQTQTLFAAFDFSTFDVTLTDSARGRDVVIRVYYPENFAGIAPVILVSHGGDGATVGHTRLAHLGSEYAANGYVAVHLNHLPSSSNLAHRLDRPADVSFVIDELTAGNVTFPPAFPGALDFSKVGHAGHSWGAYTANALGGGEFDQGNLGDARVKAICPFSPQGPGGFGAFDSGPSDNTWRALTVPTYSFVGELEKDNNVGATVAMEDWRFFPFMRYSTAADHYLSVLPGQDHGDIGGGGSPDVLAFLAQNSRVFFDVYLKGEWSKVCDIGNLAFFPGTINSRKYDPIDGLPAGCCPAAGGTLHIPTHADTTVRELTPNQNFGANVILRASGNSGGSDQEVLIKFNVSGVEGAVTEAKLRLFNQDLQPGTVSIFTTETGWDETAVTWNNSPAAQELLDSVLNSPAGQYIEWDVASLVTANGTYSFRITHTDPASAQNLTSREGAANSPELVVTFETGARIAAWRRVHFGTTANSGSAANDADFDFDSLPNLVEYGLKRRPDVETGENGALNQPRATMNHPDAAFAGRQVIEVDMPESVPADVTYEVLESDGLFHWTVIARKIADEPWDNLGSGAPILLETAAGGRILTAIGSSHALGFYPGKRVFLLLGVAEIP